ncbi:MAG: hypothetical protein KAI99_01405, partial [Cyclobacteriaceae bacterium]|nr:hypothetical protein [Cyclobacteriaceae bacterium]
MRVLFNLIIFFSSVGVSTNTFAQQKIITYYDSLRQQINTVYFINNNDSARIDGPFKKYHFNGVLEAEGQFEDGNKVGLFKEYYDNEKIRRIMYFEHGIKNGPVEVFNEEGRILQKAQYKNDTLT